MNPLRVWFEQFPKPMLQKDFAKLTGMSQSFLTSLLSDRPPWPSRKLMRKITKVTKGAVTAEMWVKMPDPPKREILDIFGQPAWSNRKMLRFLEAVEVHCLPHLRADVIRMEILDRHGLLPLEDLVDRDPYTGQFQ